MITSDDDLASRHTIPRWLSIPNSVHAGEFDSFLPKGRDAPLASVATSAHQFLDREFERLKTAWQKHQDWHDAEELISLALVANAWRDPIVLEAANALIASDVSNEAVKQFARRFVSGTSQRRATPLPVSEAELRLEISKRRRMLRLNPRDALRLAETALLYANLGQLSPSAALLERALLMAPDNRYILRSAARFYVHANQPDRAVAVLMSSKRTAEDPWLNSALLATEAASGTSPRGWKRAKALLTDSRFGDRDISELAAQMGTMEISGGSRKQALRLLRTSAVSPTENAVAQIAWLGAHSRAFKTEDIVRDLSLSHEASARSAYHDGNWSDALAESEAWHQLERFSARPAIFGSFVASIASKSLERGIMLVQSALIANPGNPALLNNLAVLHAYDGNLPSAIAALEAANSDATDVSASMTATRGLIAFRSGDYAAGVDHYGAAIDMAIKAKSRDEALRAYCFLAREVCRVSPDLTPEFTENIDKLINAAGFRNAVPREAALIRQELTDNTARTNSQSGFHVPSIDIGNVIEFLIPE